MLLEVGDSLNDMVVTRVTDSSCWFGEQRKQWSTVKQLLENNGKLQSKKNPDKDIDWTNEQAVKDFWNSFMEWSFYLAIGDKSIEEIFTVRDNTVYYQGQYFLPAPVRYGEKLPAEDGLYFGKLYTRNSSWFGGTPRSLVNVFYIVNPVTKEQIQRRDEIKARRFKTIPFEEDIAFHHTLNLRSVTSEQLNFIKRNMYEMFKDILPYKAKNGVTFHRWEDFKNPITCNRPGLCYVDNGYKGHTWNDEDYDVMLKFHPSFSNESKYYTSCYIGKCDTAALEAFAVEVQKSCDSYAENALR